MRKTSKIGRHFKPEKKVAVVKARLEELFKKAYVCVQCGSMSSAGEQRDAAVVAKQPANSRICPACYEEGRGAIEDLFPSDDFLNGVFDLYEELFGEMIR